MSNGAFGGPFGDDSTRIRSKLRAGEQLLWSGRPDPSVIFAPIDALLVPFGVAWLGFATFTMYGGNDSAGSSGPPVFFAVPFLGFGFVLLFGRFWIKRWRKARTTYGVTDQRAIVLTGERSMAESPVKNQPINIHRSRDGRHGSVQFGTSSWTNAFYGNTGMEFFMFGRSAGANVVAFYDVDNFDTLQRVLDDARAP